MMLQLMRHCPDGKVPEGSHPQPRLQLNHYSERSVYWCVLSTPLTDTNDVHSWSHDARRFSDILCNHGVPCLAFGLPLTLGVWGPINGY